VKAGKKKECKEDEAAADPPAKHSVEISSWLRTSLVQSSLS